MSRAVLVLGMMVTLYGCAPSAAGEEELQASQSAITACGSCPAGYHATQYTCDTSRCAAPCVVGQGTNMATCEPNSGSSFFQCSVSCPQGYHITRLTCDTSKCGPNTCVVGQGNDAAYCAENTGPSFIACGTSCPSGYYPTSYSCDNYNCGPNTCVPGQGVNSVTCALDCNNYTSNTIQYGQMGYYDGCQRRDVCAAGLTPHNVDSRAGYNYAKAAPGYFSCWYNIPDVICYSKPKINNYINVRICYTRADGSKVDYGCNDCY